MKEYYLMRFSPISRTCYDFKVFQHIPSLRESLNSYVSQGYKPVIAESLEFKVSAIINGGQEIQKQTEKDSPNTYYIISQEEREDDLHYTQHPTKT